MWRSAAAAAWVGVLLGTGSCSSPEPQSTTSEVPVTTTTSTTFTKTDKIVYNGSETLVIYSPLDAEAVPVIVVLHGGAADPEGYAALAEALASQGVVVMNVEWPSERPTLRSVEAVACAVRFARANASEFGGDPDNVTVLGHSAGAAVGSVIALASDLWTENCPISSVSGLPDVFIGLAGAYDPTITPGDGRSIIRQTNPELYDQLNPLNHLGTNSNLVVFLVHDSGDHVVPVESSVQFDRALADAGYDVTLTLLKGGGHDTLYRPNPTPSQSPLP